MNIDFRITGIRICEWLAIAHPRAPNFEATFLRADWWS